MMQFVTFQFWLQEVVHPKDIDCRTDLIYRYARDKFQIAAKIRPSRIAEIGVRLGYSAHAFLLGAGENPWYFGFDICGGGHGGTKIAGFEFVEVMLKRHFPNVPLSLTKTDTRVMSSVSLSDIDLFHVDGDHSTNGALHDMEMAWVAIRKGGVMLVDDYDFLPTVKMAVNRFIGTHEQEICHREHINTVRGDVVIVKK